MLLLVSSLVINNSFCREGGGAGGRGEAGAGRGGGEGRRPVPQGRLPGLLPA